MVAVVTAIVWVGNSNVGSWGSCFFSFYFFSRPLNLGESPDGLANIAVVSGSVNFIIFSRGSFFSGSFAKTLGASVRKRSGATGMDSNTSTLWGGNGSYMMSVGIRVVKAIGIGMVTVESVSMGFSRRLSRPLATGAPNSGCETGSTVCGPLELVTVAITMETIAVPMAVVTSITSVMSICLGFGKSNSGKSSQQKKLHDGSFFDYDMPPM